MSILGASILGVAKRVSFVVVSRDEAFKKAALVSLPFLEERRVLEAAKDAAGSGPGGRGWQ